MIARSMRRIVTMVAGFALLLGASTASVQAENGDGEGALAWYLTKARTEGRPIFFTECRHDEGKIVVIVPVGDVEGFFLDLYWTEPGKRARTTVGTGGKFTMSPRIELGELAHGGLYIERLMRQNVEKLLARPVRMIRPEKFATLMASKPTIRCDRETRD